MNIFIALVVFGLMGAGAVYGYRESTREAERLGQRPSRPETPPSSHPTAM